MTAAFVAGKDRASNAGNSMNQSAQILSHLQSGKSITPKDALQLFGCFRLAARIKDLRDEGHAIQMTFEDNGTSRYARYSLMQKPMICAADGQGLLSL